MVSQILKWLGYSTVLRRRGLTASLVTVAAIALIAGCGGAESRFASHMSHGQEYLAKGDFAKAGIEFRNAMQIKPKDPTARVMAGRAAERLGKVREAAGLYQSVIDSSPENTDARASLGRLLVFAGAPERAQTAIEPALRQHPDNAALLTVRASARMQLQDRAGATADADRVLKLEPTNEDAIALRAGLYRQAGDIAGATTLVSDAVQRLPESAALHQILADLYAAAGEPDHAEEQLRALVKLKPDELSYRQQLAVFYTRAHKIDLAQRELEDAVKALPQSDQAKFTLVDFISAQRTRAEGERLLRDFVARDPNNYNLRLGLGALMERFQATNAAVSTYNDVVERDPTGPNGLTARDRLAAIAFAGGRHDDAYKLVGQVLQRNPRDNEALLIRAEIALEETDSAAAITDLRAVQRDQPQNAGIRRLLARAYTANGEPALAEESLHSAVELAPRETSLRIELAQLLEQTGRSEQAVTLLEQAARDTPSDYPLREALAKAYLSKRDPQAAGAVAEQIKTSLPKSATGFYLAGLAADTQDQVDVARKEFEHALAVEPRNFQALSALVQFERKRGQLERAIATARNAAEADPSNPLPLNLLGELYLAQSKPQLADQAFTRVTQLAPEWWLPYHSLATAKSAAGNDAGAFEVYEAGIKALPAKSQLLIELALLYEKQGRVDEAIARYDTFHRQYPRDKQVTNNLAMLLVSYKHDQSSLDRARDLTSGFMNSSDSTLLDTTGWVRFKRSEYTEAVPVLRRAVERAPDSKEIRYHLGMAELRAGQTDRARSDLEAAVAGAAAFSGSDEARTALAGLKQRTT
jgi:tetratricopeptide (TPR) repeat protein